MTSRSKQACRPARTPLSGSVSAWVSWTFGSEPQDTLQRSAAPAGVAPIRTAATAVRTARTRATERERGLFTASSRGGVSHLRVPRHADPYQMHGGCTTADPRRVDWQFSSG